MRSLLVVVLLARAASADVGVGLFGQTSRYGEQPNRNVGIGAQLSIDRGRLEYLAEAALSSVSFGDDFIDGVEGTMFRGGAGVRYIARRWKLPRFDFDLGFEAIAALQDIELGDGDRIVRPEFDAGFAWHFVWEHRRGGLLAVRAFFVPSPTEAVACRGPCPTNDTVTSGYMIFAAATW
jgi:hypothetical protein